MALSLSVLCGLCAPALQAPAAGPFLVEDGHPRAEIIIAESPPRTTRLAAQELQTYLRKMTGATLAIGSKPGGKVPVRIYVGRSPYTDRLDVSSDGLKEGTYRMVSGDDWLVLIGDDTDFVPIEPWPRSNADLVSGRMQEAWNGITGKTWGYPLTQLRKHYTGPTGLFGKPNEQRVDQDGRVNVWGFDERGSFNAVCGFLRRLGVRWYLPGELGEVVPKRTSLPLPSMDETVRPAFPVRRFNFRFGHGRETAMWAMRLGVRDPYGLQVAHGMHAMTHNEAILKAHPEWFALYGGRRQNQPGQRLNQLCYSNEELFRETVSWARALFDHFKFDTVSIMPPDAYIAICQCTRCEGKDTPERGYRGRLSDHVWGFVNRVAREVGRTHPQKHIVCCAYGAYTDPPQKIDTLEPNVQVIIVGGRRPTQNLPDQRDAVRRLRETWRAKTDTPLMIFENYPFTDRGFYLPAFVARSIGEGINATKGISRGEDIWLSVRQDFHAVDIGFNHFMVYFTARMYWGGKQQDVTAMLDEYCRLFYGPAGDAMKAFFAYCEDNWQAMEKDKAKADRALDLFGAAQAKAAAGSVHARRLALIDDYLDGLRSKSRQLGQKRGPVPTLRLVGDPRGAIVIDGKLDDAAWKTCPTASTGRLCELQTGRRPLYGTSFKTAWRGDDLYFAIRCEERAGGKLNVATTRSQDQSTWYGDVVEILLATEAHAYYQIAVNPSGALIDLDRGVAKHAWFDWDSQAEAATHVANDHWTVEIRIPVVQDAGDPLHQVVGRKPIQSLPWHVNVCRQRIRDNGSEYSAFAPTGGPSFHVPMKFARFYDGRSHRFEADPGVTDYLIRRRAAFALVSKRNQAEALSAFTAMAAGPVTDLQKSDALEQAAACARSLGNVDRAMELAGAIPIEAVAKTVRMQNLLAKRKPAELVETFSDEKILRWPFWKVGEGLVLRGRAFARIGRGQEAEADLVRALPFTTDPRARMELGLALGENRENNLKDISGALEAYRRIVASSKGRGSATYYRGVLGTVRILRRQGKIPDALDTLQKVEISKLRGYWHGALRIALGDTLAAGDRKEEALAAYREVLKDPGVGAADREAARKAIETITSDR